MKNEKSRKTDEALNKKRGKRLQECRKLRNMRQQELADIAGYESSNYISMLENGVRSLTWDKAVPIAKALDVNPAYIMCETDFLYDRWGRDVNNNFNVPCDPDRMLIDFLLSEGHNIAFHVVQVGSKKEECAVSFDQITGFTFVDSRIVFTDKSGKHEGIIDYVTVDKFNIEYPFFSFYMMQLEDFISNSVTKIKNARDNFQIASFVQGVSDYEKTVS